MKKGFTTLEIIIGALIIIVIFIVFILFVIPNFKSLSDGFFKILGSFK